MTLAPEQLATREAADTHTLEFPTNELGYVYMADHSNAVVVDGHRRMAACGNTIGDMFDDACLQVTCMTLAPEQAKTVNFVQNSDASLPVTRFFTKPGTDPYDEITWEPRSAVIAGSGQRRCRKRVLKPAGDRIEDGGAQA